MTNIEAITKIKILEKQVEQLTRSVEFSINLVEAEKNPNATLRLIRCDLKNQLKIVKSLNEEL